MKAGLPASIASEVTTPAICRKCYGHPAMMEGFMDGSLREAMLRAGRASRVTEA